MSIDDPNAALGVAELLARVRGADRHAERLIDRAIEGVLKRDTLCLDERTRVAILTLLESIVSAMEHQIQSSLHSEFPASSASDNTIFRRLMEAGVFRDRALMREILDRVRQDLLATGLANRIGYGSEAGLLTRLIEHDDTAVASAARAYHAAEALSLDPDASPAGLPKAVHARIAWLVAAAIRERADADATFDRTLVETVSRNVASHDDAQRLETAAVRLVEAIDPEEREVSNLLVESLHDARPAIFIALIARLAGFDFDTARVLVVEPTDERLWMTLRADEIDRRTIARIGLALAEADPRRDIEAFADILDAVQDVRPRDAAVALVPLRFPRIFRSSLQEIARGAAL